MKHKHDTRTHTKIHQKKSHYEETKHLQRHSAPWSASVTRCSLCLVITLAVYFRTLHPSVPGGDAGELIVAAHEIGVAHPPGYPLFTLLARGAITVIPSGSVAWRVNFLTAVMSAMSASVMYLSILRLTGQDSASILAVGMFNFSRLTWAWSVTAEVFGLNNLLVAVLVLLAVWFQQTDEESKPKAAMLGAFVCGLALCNQHTTVIYVGILAVWVLKNLMSHQILSLRLLVKISLCFLAGLLPYMYLPFSSYLNMARWTWGDQRSLRGFLSHILRQEYGTFDLLKDHTGPGMLHNLKGYFLHVHSDLTLCCSVLFTVSVITVIYRVVRRVPVCELSAVSLAMLFSYSLFFAWRANLDTKNPLFLGVVERFWIQSDFLVVFLASLSFSNVSEWLSCYIPFRRWRLDVLMAVGVTVFQLQHNFHRCDQSSNYVIHDFAQEILKSMPQNAIVFTKGDLPTNSLRYLHLCEGVRSDLAVVDQEVLTYEWSLPMTRKFYPTVKFPGDLMHLSTGVLADGRQTFNFKTLLDVNYSKKRSIFGCIGVQDHEFSWKQGFELWPFGVCVQFVKKGSSLVLEEWVTRDRAGQYNWTYPLVGYDKTSWEHVATEEMWAAKTSAALHLLEKAEMVEPGPQKTAMLKYSYQLYSDALGRYRNFPVYWHKNFALLCEKLSHTVDHQQQVALLQKSVQHFKIYLEVEPADPDSDRIRQAIVSLENFLTQVQT